MSYNISYHEHLIINLYNKIQLKIANKNFKINNKIYRKSFLYKRIKIKLKNFTKNLTIYKNPFFQLKKDF